MITIEIDVDEWYPFHTMTTDVQESNENRRHVHHEVSYEFFKFYESTMDDLNAIQDKLYEMHQGQQEREDAERKKL